MDNESDFLDTLVNTINTNIARNHNIPPQNVIIIPQIIGRNMFPGSDILERSFQEQISTIKPLCNDFLSKCEKITVSDNEIKQNLHCAICLDQFKLNDELSDSKFILFSLDKLKLIFFSLLNFLTMSYIIEQDVVVSPSSCISIFDKF